MVKKQKMVKMKIPAKIAKMQKMDKNVKMKIPAKNPKKQNLYSY